MCVSLYSDYGNNYKWLIIVNLFKGHSTDFVDWAYFTEYLAACETVLLKSERQYQLNQEQNNTRNTNKLHDVLSCFDHSFHSFHASPSILWKCKAESLEKPLEG